MKAGLIADRPLGVRIDSICVDWVFGERTSPGLSGCQAVGQELLLVFEELFSIKPEMIG